MLGFIFLFNYQGIFLQTLQSQLGREMSNVNTQELNLHIICQNKIVTKQQQEHIKVPV